MGKYEYGEHEITVRGLRRAFCDELHANAALVEIVTAACGVRDVVEIGEIAMKNQGGDLHMCCVEASGAVIQIDLHVQIDKIWERGKFRAKGPPPYVRRCTRGERRWVTIAPEIWFRHEPNARQAANRITFESLAVIAEGEFAEGMRSAQRRADARFKELTRPKSKLPWWIIRRMREPRGWG